MQKESRDEKYYTFDSKIFSTRIYKDFISKKHITICVETFLFHFITQYCYKKEKINNLDMASEIGDNEINKTLINFINNNLFIDV